MKSKKGYGGKKVAGSASAKTSTPANIHTASKGAKPMTLRASGKKGK